jgi:uncharacterized lipoprotein YddW (UPF0748 family)
LPRLTFFAVACLATLLFAFPAFAQQTPLAAPIPLPPVYDTQSDNIGVAQRIAQAGGLQGRILWMDAGANVGNLNTVQKIQNVVAETKAAGFNMIVLDVKPIVGDTIYPSKYAPKLTSWKGQTVPADFDVLGQMLQAAHKARLLVYANMSVFGEGHKSVGRGLAYTHPDWQTILYEVDRSVSAKGGPSITIAALDARPKASNVLTALTQTSSLGKAKAGDTVAVVNFDARVISVSDGATAGRLTIPPRGCALLGSGQAGQWLQANAKPGVILNYSALPKYVPVQYAPEQVYTMFCDPLDPDVQQHELDIVREIVTRYDVDGIVFDDRLRYAGLNAGFSAREQKAFEQTVGHRLHWPDDIFRTSAYPGQAIIPGPEYQKWLTWRAGNITAWLSDAAALARSIRPGVQVSVYVGSWYGSYDEFGSNWAAPDVSAPFPFLTPDYKQTGFARELDWLTTGCYYQVLTLADASASGSDPGATVEAAGQLSNLVVSDAAWTYAGIYALSYQGHPDQFARAMGAATASTQGVMVFDMSQIIQYNWWNIIRQAFGPGRTPAPPNAVPGLLSEVRHEHALNHQNGVPPPEFPTYLGVSGTGF